MVLDNYWQILYSITYDSILHFTSITPHTGFTTEVLCLVVTNRYLYASKDVKVLLLFLPLGKKPEGVLLWAVSSHCPFFLTKSFRASDPWVLTPLNNWKGIQKSKVQRRKLPNPWNHFCLLFSFQRSLRISLYILRSDAADSYTLSSSKIRTRLRSSDNLFLLVWVWKIWNKHLWNGVNNKRIPIFY